MVAASVHHAFQACFGVISMHNKIHQYARVVLRKDSEGYARTDYCTGWESRSSILPYARYPFGVAGIAV